MSSYTGYTHPHILSVGVFGWIWRKVCCSNGWHLWDEVLSGIHDAHYLTCDVCPARFFEVEVMV